MRDNLVIHTDIDQQSDDWFKVKLGIISASNIKTVLVKGKGLMGFGAGAQTYAKELAGQRITGKRRAHGKFKATEWGNEHEPFCRDIYELQNFSTVEEVGFIEWPDMKCGCSPDGVVRREYGTEFKCPEKQSVFYDWVAEGKANPEYLTQIQFSMWVTGFERWDLAYYHPHFPEGKQYFQRGYAPDEEMHKQFDELIPKFNELIEHYIVEFQNKF